MSSLNPADYVSACDLLPSELGFLCQSYLGVPGWVFVAYVIGTFVLLGFLAVVVGR